MNTYEHLKNEAYADDVDVVDYHFDSPGIKGLYCNDTIAIREDLETSTQKACILAEELGHHYTSTGDILDQSDAANRKQEYRARLWSYNKLVGLCGILKAYEHGCDNLCEMSRYLGVTEKFLLDALECYRQKFGVCTYFDNYVIYFEPSLSVGKITSD